MPATETRYKTPTIAMDVNKLTDALHDAIHTTAKKQTMSERLNKMATSHAPLKVP
jgi:hypothetical protein